MTATGLELAGRRVVVMGLGRFGGGVGAARFLVEQGAEVLVTDTATEKELDRSLARLSGLPIRYRLGEHRVEDFTGAQLIVVNPAVDRPASPFLRAAGAAGVPVTSEIRLLVERLPDRGHTIGVTGSTGKSTVTAMVGHILRTMGVAAHVGGNLGGSLLAELAGIRPDHWVVLELSSFMLEDLDAIAWSPHVAVVTNISPNHLDRHGTLAAYVHAKQAILRHQVERDLAVLGATVAAWPTRARRCAVAPAVESLALRVPGEHNRENAATALAAVGAALGAAPAPAALAGFEGLPHRLHLVGEHRRVRYYNDSKSTTPASALMALRGFGAGVVHALLGGFDKHADLGPLARFARGHCRALYTIGTTGPAIAAAAAAAPGSADVVPCATLEQAVAECHRRLRPGDVVLLSPGCASWDQFENFEARGHAFRDAVARHAGAAVETAGPEPTR